MGNFIFCAVSSNNRQYIHVWNQGGIIVSNYDISQKKYSKFERMRGCNFSFIIEKGPFIKWMAATEMANQLSTFTNLWKK